MELHGIELDNLLAHLGKLVAAFLITLPVAWNREASTRAMGLRTFPLVAVASCGFVLLGLQVVVGSPAEQGRIIAGLMTGMGFIGGGAILKESGGVKGTATAAGIWSTGAVGSAVGYGEYEVALVVSVITFLILLVLTPLERELGKHDRPENSEGE